MSVQNQQMLSGITFEQALKLEGNMQGSEENRLKEASAFIRIAY